MSEWTEARRARRRRHYTPPRDGCRPDSPPTRWRPTSPPGDPRPYAGSWGHQRRRVHDERARALPLPNGGDYLITQLSPVPPPGSLRSYGSGTRTETHTDSARGPDLEQDPHEVKRLPADPTLRILIRQCYSLVKAVHHPRQVSPLAGGPGPRTISRTVAYLSSLIQPAAPTPTTRLLIQGAACEWGT